MTEILIAIVAGLGLYITVAMWLRLWSGRYWRRVIEQHHRRFMQPLIDEAIQRGIDPELVYAEVERAYKNSDYEVMLPGMLFRDYMQEKYGVTVSRRRRAEG